MIVLLVAFATIDTAVETDEWISRFHRLLDDLDIPGRDAFDGVCVHGESSDDLGCCLKLVAERRFADRLLSASG